jgi:hypothetical protein
MTRRKVDLLDPEQEPTDEDFADLMKGFIEDVMATNEIAKRNLDGLMREAFERAEPGNYCDRSCAGRCSKYVSACVFAHGRHISVRYAVKGWHARRVAQLKRTLTSGLLRPVDSLEVSSKSGTGLRSPGKRVELSAPPVPRVYKLDQYHRSTRSGC